MKKNTSEKTKNASKTPKNHKYYYTKASILRSAIIAVLCSAVFIGFFVCFMIYGGTDRNPNAFYNLVSNVEKEPLSMISEIEADGNGRIYLFYRNSFEVNAYDEKGNFKESYQIPGLKSEDEIKICDGGIVCENGYMYLFNEVGNVFVYKDGKSTKKIEISRDRDECDRIIKLYESKESLNKVSFGDKTFYNNFVSVTDNDGNLLKGRLLMGLIFSPFSMVMAIVMTVVTYLAVRRYNKKVRNQKVNTLFKKNVIIK